MGSSARATICFEHPVDTKLEMDSVRRCHTSSHSKQLKTPKRSQSATKHLRTYLLNAENMEETLTASNNV